MLCIDAAAVCDRLCVSSSPLSLCIADFRDVRVAAVLHGSQLFAVCCCFVPKPFLEPGAHRPAPSRLKYNRMLVFFLFPSSRAFAGTQPRELAAML